jgi:hypothetical protein
MAAVDMRRAILASIGLAVILAGCGNPHDQIWHQGYSYGAGAAQEDYQGSLTGAAANDACNHALQAVPDGFGDPSNPDWVNGFMAGCEHQLAHQ